MATSLFIEHQRQHRPPSLQSQGHVGKGLCPLSGTQWKPGPFTALLGPAPSWVLGATGSGLLKLLFTVAYTDGLGLDSSPQQLTAET